MPVGEGEAECLGSQMRCLGGARIHRWDVEAFQDVQALEDGDSSGRVRRPDDPTTSIRDGEPSLMEDWSVGGKILFGDETTVVAHSPVDSLRDLTLIEC